MENKKINVLTLFFAVLFIVALSACIVLFVKNKELSDTMASERVSSKEAVEVLQHELEESEGEKLKDRIRESMEEGKSPVTVLREIYSDYAVYTVGNKYNFVKLDNNIPLNEYDADKFKYNDEGFLEYKENNKDITYKGIDVSKYQNDIDFEQVKASGIDFVIIRLGYRGYGTGSMQLDEKYEENVKGAIKAGLSVGVYFFSQAINEEEAKEEADFVLENIKPYKIKGPIVFDTEEVTEADGRMKNITKDELTDITLEFLKTIEKEGYEPMVYANLRWFMEKLDMSRLADYDKWFASYTMPFYFPYKITMWQYSDTAKIPGIAGNVDVNISFKKWD